MSLVNQLNLRKMLMQVKKRKCVFSDRLIKGRADFPEVLLFFDPNIKRALTEHVREKTSIGEAA